MKNILILIILFFFTEIKAQVNCCIDATNLPIEQVHILIPNKGIEGIPVIVDTTTISDVIKLYGDNYFKQETSLMTIYKYETIGLTFKVSLYDKNQVIRSIVAEAPFQAKTKNGIILNESTMNDIWKLYDSEGCFTSENNAYSVQNGISFFIKKESNEKGYNPNEKIYKIEINNNGLYGIPSRVNFEFNRKPIEEKLFVDCGQDSAKYIAAYNFIINDSINQGKSIAVSDTIIDLTRDWFSEDLGNFPKEQKILDQYRENKGFIWSAPFYSPCLTTLFPERRDESANNVLFFSTIEDNMLIVELLPYKGQFPEWRPYIGDLDRFNYYEMTHQNTSRIYLFVYCENGNLRATFSGEMHYGP